MHHGLSFKNDEISFYFGSLASAFFAIGDLYSEKAV